MRLLYFGLTNFLIPDGCKVQLYNAKRAIQTRELDPASERVFLTDAVASLERGFVRGDDGQIHHYYSDAGAGLPILLLHASPASARTTAPLAAALAPYNPVSAPDTMGNGLSDPAPQACPDMIDYARAMLSYMSLRGFDRYVVYGTHTGAHIAIEMAIAAPDNVVGLILDGVALMQAEQRAEFLERYAPVMVPDMTGGQFHWAWNFVRDQMLFYPYYRRDPDHVRRPGILDPHWLHELTVDVLMNLETYHKAYHAVFRQPVEQRLPLVRQATLCIATGLDPLDATIDSLFELLPRPQKALVVIEGEATEAEAKAAVIRRFVAALQEA